MTTGKQRLLILGARPLQLPAYTAAHELGVDVIAIDPDPAAPGRALASVFAAHDLADVAACLAVARQERVNGVLTLGAEYPIPLAARLAAELDLPGLDPSRVGGVTDKLTMHDVLASAGVAVPETSCVSSLSDARQAVAAIDGPTIVKPADSSGGRGVTALAQGADTGSIDTAYALAQPLSRTGRVLVSAYVDGPEFSVEAMTYAGSTTVVATTDKVTSGRPHHVEVGHSQPSSRAGASAVAALAVEAITALGIESGPSHTEIRLDGDRPVVIEVGARLGGGYITSHLVPLSTGVDLTRATVQVALGRTPDLSPSSVVHGGAAVRFFTPPAGTLAAVRGADEAATMPGVEVMQLDAEPGDVINPLRDARDRIGHVIASGIDPEAARARAAAAVERVEFEIA